MTFYRPSAARPKNPRQGFHSPGGGDVVTHQSFKDECDINLIVRRHAQTGLWDHVAKRQPHYGDFSEARDLADAVELVNQANQGFMELPAAVRKAVQNDPVKLLQAMADPLAFDALVQLGLPVEDSYKSPQPPGDTSPEPGIQTEKQGESPEGTPQDTDTK